MPEKGGGSYQNTCMFISLARQKSDHKNNVCCRGHLNVDVLKEAKTFIDKYLQVATSWFPLSLRVTKSSKTAQQYLIKYRPRLFYNKIARHLLLLWWACLYGGCLFIFMQIYINANSNCLQLIAQLVYVSQTETLARFELRLFTAVTIWFVDC